MGFLAIAMGKENTLMQGFGGPLPGHHCGVCQIDTTFGRTKLECIYILYTGLVSTSTSTVLVLLKWRGTRSEIIVLLNNLVYAIKCLRPGS